MRSGSWIVRQSLQLRVLQFGNHAPSQDGVFALVYLSDMGIGRPALVCITTKKTITIDGKRYRLLKMMYDLNGEYVPLATIRL